MGGSPRKAGADTAAVLADFGYTAGEIAALDESGIIGVSTTPRS
jgi:crotonobetainyl-CoA:carnitine CoA-transferase CaiB-like acyl-CoA transferase